MLNNPNINFGLVSAKPFLCIVVFLVSMSTFFDTTTHHPRKLRTSSKRDGA